MTRIKWAPRVPMEWIRRLYLADARGIPDAELLNEVGYAFYARAQSIMDVNRAHRDKIARCPDCGSDTGFDASIDAYRCSCGWSMDRREYLSTYQGKQLVGYSINPFAERFMSEWEQAAQDTSAQMRAIDYLIHSFHWELMGEKQTRPIAINFIEGRLKQIIAMILDLAYGDSDEKTAQFERWMGNAKRSSSFQWIRERIKDDGGDC